MNFQKELYGVGELADMLSVSPWSVRTWLRLGKLKAVKCGARVLVPRESIESFLKPRPVTSGGARKATH